MDFLQKIRLIWQKISLIQQALLITVVLTFIIIIALLVYWARKPEMRILYQGLGPEEASKITEKISEKGIVYELRNGGSSIYAPEKQVYQLRLDMAREGLPSGQQSGYKIFDKEKIGISPFVQNVNLKRALQEELAKSIQMIDGVVFARVHIVSSEQTLFTPESGKTTASVALKLRPGYRISALNVAAITNLIAGSVEGLSPETVTVIDSQGRLLSTQSDQTLANGAGTVADYRERVEQNLAQKVEDMLTAVLGPGRAVVRVSAVIDMNSVNTVTEIYDPSAKATTKEEITSGSEIETNGSPAEGKPPASGSTKKDEKIVTEYQVGKTVKQEVVLPGKIKTLSVAAFVDLSAADSNEADSDESPAMIMELSEVEEIIRNALGLKQTDSLKVVHAKFYHPTESIIDEKPSNWPRYIAIAKHASLGIMAICALLVLKIFSSAKKKATSSVPTGQLTGGEVPMGLLPSESGKSESLMLRRQIASALQRNPEQVKQLFNSWIEQKE